MNRVVFRRMIRMIVLAQAGCQRRGNSAVYEKKGKQNDSDSFHGTK
jgi:hypothetical protein